MIGPSDFGSEDRRPFVQGGELTFAPCFVGCPGEGSTLHTAHRLRELRRPVPAYLHTQIAGQAIALEVELAELVERMTTAKGPKARAMRSALVRTLSFRALLAAWMLDVVRFAP